MAHNVTPASIKIRFPQFNTLSDSFIQLVIDEALLSGNVNFFRSGQDHAITFLTAHLLEVASSSQGGTVGSLTKEKVGDLERTYSSGEGAGLSLSGLNSTSYGQEYIRFRKTCVSSPFFAF